VVVLPLKKTGQPIEERGAAVAAIPPAPTHPVGGGASGPDGAGGAGGAGGLAAPPPPTRNAAPVSLAVSSRRDSALAARDRANAAGAQKNSVPSLLLAQTMLQASDQALQRGDQSLALRGYVEAAQRYAQAREEARAMEREAQHMIQRVTPVVQALPAGRTAANAGVFLARAESLLHEQDFTLAKLAAQSAEQYGIDAGIAPPSAQPADARGAIDVLLDDLGRALASQRIANLRVLYPGLTEEERRSWEAFFREWNQITAKFTMEDFKTQGASATGNVRALFQYVPAKGGAPRIDRRRFAMRFEKKDVGWRLAAVTELK